MLLLDKHLYISIHSILKIFTQVHGDRLRTGHRFDGIPHALRPHAACRFVKDVLQIKEKRKGPVKGRASLKDGWENGCKPVHGRLAEL